MEKKLVQYGWSSLYMANKSWMDGNHFIKSKNTVVKKDVLSMRWGFKKRSSQGLCPLPFVGIRKKYGCVNCTFMFVYQKISGMPKNPTDIQIFRSQARQTNINHLSRLIEYENRNVMDFLPSFLIITRIVSYLISRALEHDDHAKILLK